MRTHTAPELKQDHGSTEVPISDSSSATRYFPWWLVCPGWTSHQPSRQISDHL